jgi:hypothetical protein
MSHMSDDAMRAADRAYRQAPPPPVSPEELARQRAQAEMERRKAELAQQASRYVERELGPGDRIGPDP